MSTNSSGEREDALERLLYEHQAHSLFAAARMDFQSYFADADERTFKWGVSYFLHPQTRAQAQQSPYAGIYLDKGKNRPGAIWISFFTDAVDLLEEVDLAKLRDALEVRKAEQSIRGGRFKLSSLIEWHEHSASFREVATAVMDRYHQASRR